MTDLLFLIVNPLLDRARGTHSYYVWVMAFVFSTIISNNVLIIIFLTLAFVLGESFGWGEVIGAFLADRPMKKNDNNKWQIGVLSTNIKYAIIVRGFMWAFPVGLIEGLSQYRLWAFSAIWVGFVASLYITKHFLFNADKNLQHRINRADVVLLPVNDYVRGFITALIYIIGNAL